VTQIRLRIISTALPIAEIWSSQIEKPSVRPRTGRGPSIADRSLALSENQRCPAAIGGRVDARFLGTGLHSVQVCVYFADCFTNPLARPRSAANAGDQTPTQEPSTSQAAVDGGLVQVYEFGHANKRQLRVTGVFHRLQDRKGAPARKFTQLSGEGKLGSQPPGGIG
jgi:hypothetical protein